MSKDESYAIGYLTGRFLGSDDRWYANVFVPTPPNPFNGLLYIVPEEKIVKTPSITTEQATKMIISMGIMTPGEKGSSKKHNGKAKENHSEE